MFLAMKHINGNMRIIRFHFMHYALLSVVHFNASIFERFCCMRDLITKDSLSIFLVMLALPMQSDSGSTIFGKHTGYFLLPGIFFFPFSLCDKLVMRSS